MVLINQLGRTAEGRAELELVLHEAGHDAGLAARAAAALGFSYLPGSHIDTDREFLHRARSYAHGCDDPAVLTAVLVNEATVAMSVGDPQAWPAVDQLLAAATSTRGRQQVARGLCNVADAATWLGQHSAAEQFLRDGAWLAGESGAPYDQTTARGTALRLDCAQGNWVGLAARAAALVDSVPDMPGLAADGQLVLGLLAVTHGDWSQARHRLEAAELRRPDDALVPMAATAAGAYLRVLLATDDLTAATELADNALTRVRAKGIWPWAADLAPSTVETFLRAGRPTDAAALIAEFDTGTRGADAPLAAAALELCRARLTAATEPDRARTRFTHAAELYANLPRPYEALIAAEEAATCQLLGEPVHALTDLQSVADRFTALGSSWDAARCRHMLRVHGVTPAHSGGRPSFGHLSPREQEVAVLAATGQTNRQIAEVLFLSPRTVEQHVASAMRKLEVHTRGELGEALDRSPNSSLGQARRAAVDST